VPAQENAQESAREKKSYALKGYRQDLPRGIGFTTATTIPSTSAILCLTPLTHPRLLLKQALLILSLSLLLLLSNLVHQHHYHQLILSPSILSLLTSKMKMANLRNLLSLLALKTKMAELHVLFSLLTSKMQMGNLHNLLSLLASKTKMAELHVLLSLLTSKMKMAKLHNFHKIGLVMFHQAFRQCYCCGQSSPYLLLSLHSKTALRLKAHTVP